MSKLTSIASIILDNGTEIPVPRGYTRMSDDGSGLLFTYSRGSDLWFTDWTGLVAGLDVADMKDGEVRQTGQTTVTRHGDVYRVADDGSEWTRHGAEMAVWTPEQAAVAA